MCYEAQSSPVCEHKDRPEASQLSRQNYQPRCQRRCVVIIIIFLWKLDNYLFGDIGDRKGFKLTLFVTERAGNLRI